MRTHRRNWDLLVENPNPADDSVVIIACAQCGKNFGRLKPIKGRRPRFCSHTCDLAATKVQRLKYRTINRNCETCGKAFSTDKWKNRRHCSNACGVWSRSNYTKLVDVNCTTCGKSLKRQPASAEHSKNFYCGYECMAKAKILDAPRTNKYENVRAWFSRFNRMKKCERCGYCRRPRVLVIHHKDRNRGNNKLSNLEVLCPTCHAEEHENDRKNGWKGHKSATPAKIRARLETARKRNELN